MYALKGVVLSLKKRTSYHYNYLKTANFRAYISQLITDHTTIERTFCTLVNLALIVRRPLASFIIIHQLSRGIDFAYQLIKSSSFLKPLTILTGSGNRCLQHWLTTHTADSKEIM